MHNREERAFLAAYAKNRPQLDIDDLLKLLYQSAFGCGHFAPGEAQVLDYLAQELAHTQASAHEEAIQPILGRYVRANIVPCIKRGLHPWTLARLFMLTADKAPEQDARAWFDASLLLLEEMIRAGELPFDAQAALARLEEYRAQGCPSLHHSARYRDAYHPAYRVLLAEYAQLLPLFERIDRTLSGGKRVILAIDGNSGSGKSTLAALLKTVYADALIVHMDDFFLQLHQRTPERFAQPGGNVDHERFLCEVLLPMRRGEAFWYRPFDCGRMAIGEGERLEPPMLCIAEGSYSLHPALEAAYDLKIVLRISPAAQVERILKRNGPQTLSRFISEWIPMENRYFDATQIEQRGDLLIGVTPLEGGAARYDVMEMEGRA